jgi:hypothetical protein
MVVSMVNPKWILQLLCWKCFYSGGLGPVSFLGAFITLFL